MTIPVPPRYRNSDLVVVGSVFVMALAFSALAALAGGDIVLLMIAFGQGGISGGLWADYWRKRDAFKRWTRARQDERESQAPEDAPD